MCTVDNFWAKTLHDPTQGEVPGISVRDHCVNVGCVAQELVQSLPRAVRELLPPGAITLAALHDLGKISVGFQRKCPAWLVQHNLLDAALKEFWQGAQGDHSVVSQFCLQERLRGQGAELWAVAVGAHHGRVHGRRISRDQVREVAARAAWEQVARERLIDELINLFGKLPANKPQTDRSDLWLLAGLIAVADWIGSNEKFFSPAQGLPVEDAARQAAASLQAINWSGGRMQPGKSFEQTFGIAGGPNALQAALQGAAVEPGLYIVEGPMGCGKTEAALAAAQGLISRGLNDGLYFGLPTQVTSNRIHARVGRFLENALAERAQFRLAHAASWLNEDQTIQIQPAVPGEAEGATQVADVRSWFASSRHALLARYGVGTIDQALQAVVAVKHFFVRRFGLAGKVVILDEVHSYDGYTGALIKQLVKELLALRCSVVVLSATLTRATRGEILDCALGAAAKVAESTPATKEAYPLITFTTPEGTVRQIPLSWNDQKEIALRVEVFQENEIIDGCLRRAEAGQHVLYLRNTVAEAQASYRAFAAAMRCGTLRLGLLHSRFPFFRREDLEDEWLKRLGKERPQEGEGSILVATQVVEQSVDIDLDFIVSDLAPMDMLLQRMGRLWRHPRRGRNASHPEFWINVPPIDLQGSAKELRTGFGKTGRVYVPYVLLRTLQVMSGRSAIRLPSDIRQLLEATYAEMPEESGLSGWRDLRQELEREKEALANEADAAMRVLGQPSQTDREEVLTRRAGMPTRSVILLKGCQALGPSSWRLTGLEQTTIEASGREWRHAVACTLHRNLVRIPAYQVPRQKAPDWLSLHVPGQPAWALVQEDGKCLFPEANTDSVLEYGAGLGVYTRSGMKRPKSWEDDDEFDY